MARTVFSGSPKSAEFPAANFPALMMVNRRPVLAFDAGADETAYWVFVAPQGITGTINVIITYMMASATSNNIIWQAALEAVTDGDSTDLDAGTSFDTVNSASATAVPGTAGYIDQVVIAMTNADSVAAGDYVRLSVNRDANAAGDTAAGDAYLLAVELRDSV